MNKYHNLAKNFRKKVDRDWGKKCKDFSFGCIICQSYRTLDDLEELGDFLDDMSKRDKNKKHEHRS